MDIQAYRNNLSHEEMRQYLAEYPDMARNVAAHCPEHRLFALSVYGLALKDIKKSEQTLDQVETALRQDGAALRLASRMILRRHPDLYRVAIASNGCALKYVPEKYRWDGIYEDAVRSSGYAILQIPEDQQSRELWLLALESTGEVLKYFPKQRITKAMSIAAVKSSPLAIRYVPKRFIDKELALIAVSESGSLTQYIPEERIDANLALIAVSSDWRAIAFVPSNALTRDVCDTALESSPLALEHVPKQHRDKQMLEAAVSRDWRAIRFIAHPTNDLLMAAIEQSPRAVVHFPKRLVTTDMLCSWLRSFLDEDDKPNARLSSEDIEWLRGLGRGLLRDSRVASFMRAMGCRSVDCAKWTSSRSYFTVIETVERGNVRTPSVWYESQEASFKITSHPKNLTELTALLDGDLSRVEFEDYPFADFDESVHDLSSAIVPAGTLISLKAYDDTAYRTLVSPWEDALSLRNSERGELAPAAKRADMVLPIGESEEDPYYYVSDLHLNHKLKSKFPEAATEAEIHEYLHTLAREMVESAPAEDTNKTLLIAGDTSYNIDVAKIFFKSLRQLWKGLIVCVLGNHELWHYSRRGPLGRMTPTVDTVVTEYRDMLREFRISLLHNEVLIRYRGQKIYRLRKWQLDNMSDEELSDRLSHSSVTILGGLGFTGLCDSFNATHGIYRDVITSRDDDRSLSREFSDLHGRIRRLAPKASVVVLTHTPITQWSTEGLQPGWVYVSGHTHRNEYVEEGELRAYADNQVGYHGTRASLMRFYLLSAYDPFRLYPDGIHEVSRMDYRDFNRVHGVYIESFTRKGKILMLKRQGTYLFLFEWAENERLYLLSGARINGIDVQEPQYYYDNMLAYVALVKKAFSGYENAIHIISDEIKSFGGVGTVHGCIVDIDFMNHVYLDPYTGALTFYYATSTTDRYEFHSMDKLLSKHCRPLLQGYRSVAKKAAASGGKELILVRGIEPSVSDSLHKADTLMYKPSNVMRSIQYMFDTSIIRIWREDVIGSPDYSQGCGTQVAENEKHIALPESSASYASLPEQIH